MHKADIAAVGFAIVTMVVAAAALARGEARVPDAARGGEPIA